jgi:hypothetical protein
MVDSLLATPEATNFIKANALTQSGLNFSGAYIPQLGRKFTLEVSNMSVRAILNQTVKQSPTAKIWVIKRYDSNHTFFIRLNARHEDALMSNGKLVRF